LHKNAKNACIHEQFSLQIYLARAKYEQKESIEDAILRMVLNSYDCWNERESKSMDYIGVALKNSISIDELYSVHYFEYRSDFFFSGEEHDFWEFLYVDKGEIHITSGSETMLLKKGEIIFHEPNEFHALKATGKTAPNLVVISFSCHGEAMDALRKNHFYLDETEHNLLAEIITEASGCFEGKLDNPWQKQLIPKKSVYFAAEQMIRLHLEQFLIHILRRCDKQSAYTAMPSAPPKISGRCMEADTYQRIVKYLEANLASQLTIERICYDNMISRSTVQKLFHSHCQTGVINYFLKLKIDAAKEMMRTGHLNFTQVAERLGYSSIHYFSRQFKKQTGMTPTEYASSVKAMVYKR